MQSYATFTVGGLLSVKAHGRYMGYGPLINTVEFIQIVLVDGSIHEATATNTNQHLFFGAIGGYGGIGVITEATLRLVNVDNCRIARAIYSTSLRPFAVNATVLSVILL